MQNGYKNIVTEKGEYFQLVLHALYAGREYTDHQITIWTSSVSFFLT